MDHNNENKTAGRERKSNRARIEKDSAPFTKGIKETKRAKQNLLIVSILAIASFSAILSIDPSSLSLSSIFSPDNDNDSDPDLATGDAVSSANGYGDLITPENGLPYRLAFRLYGSSFMLAGWDANLNEPSGSVTIPSEVTSTGGTKYPVTSIGDRALYSCSGITSFTVEEPNAYFTSEGGVLFNEAKTTLIKYPAGNPATSYTIPSSVTSIGYSAFNVCTSLASVTIPSSVTSIGEGAFFRCTSLASVTIPSSVTSIGRSAFAYCTSLASVTIPSSVTSIGEWAFSSCTSLTSVTIPSSVTSISGSAFRDCTALTSVTIPSSVTSIGDAAFNGCGSLTSVTIPSSVTSIGRSAFAYCTSLASVTIPSSVTSIGDAAFNDCGSLTSVTIPSSVTSIGSSAFAYCTSLASVTIPSSVTSIGSAAFRHTSLASVTIPSSVTSIGNSAFEYTSLTSVTIPSSVTSIGSEVFQYCTSLTSVTIPSSVTSIGSAAFNGCGSLTSVTIPSSVTSIGRSAFRYTSLTSVTIPSSVTSIGINVFQYCTSLTSVTISLSGTSISDNAFQDCTSLTSVTILSSVTSIGRYTFSGCGSLTSVTIPSSVTSIDAAAFNGCTSLASVTIPSSVTSIGYSAFNVCTSLASVTIPSSVTYISSNVFNGCTSLASVTIPSSVTSIGYNAFGGCISLTSVTIPSSVTSIDDNAFNGCTSLASVTIPSSVTSIGSGAFSGISRVSFFFEGTALPATVENAFTETSSFYSHGIKNASWWAGKDYTFPADRTGAYYDLTLAKASGETVFPGFSAVKVPSSTNNYSTALPITQAWIDQYLPAGTTLYYMENGETVYKPLVGAVLNTDVTGTGSTGHTLTYDVNGGSGSIPSPYTGLGTVTLSDGSGLSKPNSLFSGWNTSPSGIGGTHYDAGTEYHLTGNVTLYAEWLQYTITFDSNGAASGSQAPISGYGPNLLPSSSTLSKADYYLSGWNTSPQGVGYGTHYALGDTYNINGNVTLYAEWSQYTITFDSNGATSGSQASVKGYLDTALPGTSSPPVTIARTNYYLGGWNSLPSGEGAHYGLGSVYVLRTNVTLYAEWSQYTIAYNVNGATSGSNFEYLGAGQVTLNSGSGIAKTGYALLGWNTSPNGTGTPYALGQTADLTGPLTLYASWQGLSVTVTYHTNGGTAEAGAPPTSTGRVGDNTWTLPDGTQYTRAGYTLTGWSTVSMGLRSVYAPGSTVPFEYGVTDVYAVWSGNAMTVTFHGNNGSPVSGAPTSETGSTGAQYRLPDGTQYTRAGYTLIGWDVNSSGTNIVYTPGGNANFTYGETNVYAVWQSNVTTVTYHGNGGTGPSAVSGYTDGSYTLPNASQYTRLGYTLIGWSIANDGSADAGYALGSAQTFTYGVTDLYAVWSGNAMTVTYHTNGGTSAAQVSGNVGDVWVLPSAGSCTRPGYVLGGWARVQGGPAVYAPGENTVLAYGVNSVYAVWTANMITVTFDPNGGTIVSGVSASVSGHIGGSYTVPSALQCMSGGRTLLGWDTSSGAYTVVYVPGASAVFADNVTALYAVWSDPARTHTVAYDYGTEGSGPLSSSGAVGGTWVLPSASQCSRPGYALTGWSKTSGGPSDYTPGQQTVFDDLVTNVYAVWTPVTFTVVYNANYGSGTPQYETGTHGMPWTLPSASDYTRAGYALAGWSAVPNGTVMYTPGQNTVFAYGVTDVYAVWEPNVSITVTFDPNGGLRSPGAPSSAAGNAGAPYTVPNGSQYTRSGYTLIGWDTSSGANTVVYGPGQVAAFVYGGSVTYTLYAVWSSEATSVNYHANGGTGSPSSSVGVTGSDWILPTGTDYVKRGYTLLGWSVSDDGSFDLPQDYAPGQQTVFDASVTNVYAVWEIDTSITYSIIVIAGPNGTVTVDGSNTHPNGGSDVTVRITADYGYLIRSVTDNGVSMHVNALFKDSMIYTITGVLEDHIVTVTFGVDTADHHDVSGTVVPDAGPADGFAVTLNGQTFMTSADGRFTFTVQGGYSGLLTISKYGYTEYLHFVSGVASDVNLQQIPMVINEYRVAFNAADAQGVWPQEVTVDHGYPMSSVPSDPVRGGYTFMGWHLADGTLFDATQIIYGDTQVFAEWSANPMTVTYRGNGGTGPSGSSGHTGGSYTLPNASQYTREGYMLLGWSAANDNTVDAGYAPGSAQTFTYGITNVYAVWEGLPSEVIFHANGGTAAQGAPLSAAGIIGGSYTLPNASQYVRGGYTLMGWSLAQNGSVLYAPGANETFAYGVTSVYAVWSADPVTVTYDPGAGLPVPGAVTSVTGAAGDAWIIPDVTQYTYAGRTLLGWDISSNANTAVYIPGSSSFLRSDVTVIYAVWSAAADDPDSPFEVRYHGNGGTVPSSSWGRDGEEWILPNASFCFRPGYVLEGWSLTQNGQLAYTPGQVTVFDPAVTNVHALWTPVSVTVHYHGNGGAGAPPSAAGAIGTPWTLPNASQYVRSGYALAGWSLVMNGSVAYLPGQTVMFSSSVTDVYAVWSGNAMTITFDANGGTAAQGAPAYAAGVAGGSFTLPNASQYTRAGYALIGWSLAQNGMTVDYAPGQTAAFVYGGSVTYTLYAVWSSDSVSVTYHANGGTGTPPSSIGAAGTAWTLPSASDYTRLGYILEGWSLTPNGPGIYHPGQTAAFDPSVTDVYAVWTANQMTVTYHGNGGTGIPAQSSGVTGESFTVPAAQYYVRQGYTLAGWDTDRSGKTVVYAAGGTAVFAYGVNDLYAVWSGNAMTVTYHGNGGTGPLDVTGHTGISYTLPNASQYTRVGYSLIGWSVSDDGTSDFVPGAVQTFTGGVTDLYAVWAGNPMTVIFRENGGTAAPNAPAFSEGAVGGSYTLPSASQYTRAGHNLAGWSLTPGGAVKYTPAQTATFIHGETMLYAVWNARTVTVTFNTSGGTLAGDASAAGTAGETFTLPTAAECTRAGRTLLGWDTSSSAYTAVYVPGATITFTGDMTLYAVWSADPADPEPSFMVTYHGEGGTVPSSSWGKHGDPWTIPDAGLCLRPGYTLTGWSLTPGGPRVYSPGATAAFDSGVTDIYAIWTPVSVTVYYHGNGGTGMPSSSGGYGTSWILPSASQYTRPGYTLTGWSLTQDGAVAYVPGQIAAFDPSVTDVYAIWSGNSVTVTYYGNGGTGPAAAVGSVGRTFTLPSAAQYTRAGYVLAGWSLANDGTSDYDAGSVMTFAYDITELYAVWIGEPVTVVYRGNGGSPAQGVPSSVTGNAGGEWKLPNASQYVRPGYTLIGWAAVPGGTVEYAPGQITSFVSNVTAVYAVWEGNSITVLFDPNGGTAAPGTISSITGIAGGTFTLPGASQYSNGGRTLLGWDTSSSAYTVVYVPGQTVTFAYGVTAVYAVWSAAPGDGDSPFAVIYHGNGGNVPASSWGRTGETWILPSVSQCMRDGYVLAGWSLTQNGAITYAPGQTAAFDPSIGNVYAVWSGNAITVMYRGNGGTGPESSSGTVGGEWILPSESEYMRPGYILTGWSRTPGGSLDYSPGETAAFEYGVSSVYALWSPNSVTVTFDPNGGTLTSDASASGYVGETYTVPSAAQCTLAGRTLLGWDTSPNANTIVYAQGSTAEFTDGVAALYAVWSADPADPEPSFMVTYHGEGGNVPSSAQGRDGEEWILPSADICSRSGYVLAGWSLTQNGAIAYDPGQVTVFDTSVIDVYAVWTHVPVTFTVVYSANGGYGTPQYETGTHGMPWTLPSASDYARAGYTLAGWSTVPNGSVVYVPGENTVFTAAVTDVYAVWTIIPMPVTVVFDGNGGTAANGTAASVSGNTGASYQVPGASDYMRSGYTLRGWDTSPDAHTVVYTPGQMAEFKTSETRLYAVWSPVSANPGPLFEVRYHGNGGTGPLSAWGRNGEQWMLPDASQYTRAGYVLRGWDTSPSGTNPVYAEGGIASFDPSVINVYAVWEPVSVTVYYRVNHGSPSQGAPLFSTGVTGGTWTLPDASQYTRAGYTLRGWSLTQDGAIVYVPGQTAAFDPSVTDVYASWSADTVTVTFDANGGTALPGAPSSASGAIGASYTLPNASQYTRIGYVLIGWSLSSSGMTVNYAPGQSAVYIAGEITLYAIWSADTMAVTYHGNGGTGTPPSSIGAPGSVWKLPSVYDYTKAGYTLVGWSTVPNGPVTYAPGSSAAFDPNITDVYAVWSPNAMTVTFNGNGGTGTPANVSGTVGTSYTLPDASQYARAGYVLAGWDTSPSGTTVIYASGGTAAFVYEITELYAVWTADTMTVTYHGNGGTGPSSSVGSADAYYTLPSASQYIRQGYILVGWSAANDGTSDFAPGSQQTFVYGITELYAVWSKNPVTVTFRANGGTASPGVSGYVSGFAGDPYTLPSASDYARAGYTLAGWSTVPNGSVTYAPGQTAVFGEDVTDVYAVWSADTITVTFYPKGGTLTGNTSVSGFAGSLYLIPDASRCTYHDGRTLLGWDTSSGAYTVVYAPGASVTFKGGENALYAVWSQPAVPESPFEVKYNYGAGTGPSSAWGTEGAAWKLPSASQCIRTGYVLAGWAVTPGGSVVYVPGQIAAFDPSVTNVYAVWEGAEVTVIFHGDGGTAAQGAPSSASGKVNDPYTLPSASDYVRAGYTLTGWSRTPGGSSVYNPGAPAAFEYGVNSFYALWSPNSVTVTFDPNGGTLSVPNTVSGSAGGTYTVPTASQCINANQTLLGWDTSPDAYTIVYAPGSTAVFTGDVTLYAVWDDPVRTHEVAYHYAAGTGPSSSSGIAGGQWTLPDASLCFRSGYALAGWSRTPGGSPDYVPGQIAVFDTSVIDVYAVWSPVSVTVVYNANGGTGMIGFVTGTHGSPWTLPSASDYVRAGYALRGWDTSPGASNAVYLPGAPAAFAYNVTDVYAVWDPVSVPVTVVFDGTGGTGTPFSETGSEGSAYTVPDSGYTRSGYLLKGWDTSPAADTVVYVPGMSVTFKTSETTLYAVWSPVSSDPLFEVRYHGSEGTVPSSAWGRNGDAWMLPSISQCVRDGYVLAGWSRAADGMIAYTPGQLAVFDANVTDVYAVWTPVSVTVYYHGEGGTGPLSASGGNGDAWMLPSASEYTRSGYVLAGWAVTRGGSAVYAPGQPVTFSVSVTDVYAVWQRDSAPVTVVFDGTGGTGTRVSASGNAGNAYTVPDGSQYTLDGHTLAGWDTSPSAKMIVYAPGASAVFRPDETVLYAVWSGSGHTVTFHADGASGIWPQIKTVKHGEIISQPIPSPSRQGYAFAGWYTSGGTQFDPYAVVKGSADVYAYWNAVREVTITVAGNGIGTIQANIGHGWFLCRTGTVFMVQDGTAVELNAVPGERSGFSGWTGYITSSDSIVSLIVTENLSLTAEFAESTDDTPPGPDDPNGNGDEEGGNMILFLIAMILAGIIIAYFLLSKKRYILILGKGRETGGGESKGKNAEDTGNGGKLK